MPTDDLKKRIEALNRRPLKNVPEEEKPELSGLRRKLKKQAEAKLASFVDDKVVFPLSEAPAVSAVPATPGAPFDPSTGSGLRMLPTKVGKSRAKDDGPSVTLEQVVDGVAVESPAGGEYYHIEVAAQTLDHCACEIHTCFTPLLGHPAGGAVERIVAVCKSERIEPEEVVFLDLETTGLSMTPVFLIGTMECTCDGFVFKQYFARDYSEETCILSAFSERMGDAKMIVTFNGKSFDVPYLHNRAIAAGMKLPKPKSHLDLLHEARRHYGRQVPNHKLQTLEQIICGRHRGDDIPGSQIPAAYHEFVRTGNARKIGMILRHNLHDLLTMADLMHRMWQR